jgi:ABC-type uncharacterized transport system substrate-binding protein
MPDYDLFMPSFAKEKVTCTRELHYFQTIQCKGQKIKTKQSTPKSKQKCTLQKKSPVKKTKPPPENKTIKHCIV